MSKTWNEEELQIVSKYMKDHGWMSYEEFCKWLKDRTKEDKEDES